MKIPSSETSQLIEQLVLEYGLEKELIEKDPILKEKLGSSDDLANRIFTKLLFSKEAKKAMADKKPLSGVFVHSAICKIVKNILNNKINPSQLSLIMQNELKIPSEISNQISQKILASQFFKNDLSEITDEEDYAEKQTKYSQNKSTQKGIGQELI
jgi:hypothetical protein